MIFILAAAAVVAAPIETPRFEPVVCIGSQTSYERAEGTVPGGSYDLSVLDAMTPQQLTEFTRQSRRMLEMCSLEAVKMRSGNQIIYQPNMSSMITSNTEHETAILHPDGTKTVVRDRQNHHEVFGDSGADHTIGYDRSHADVVRIFYKPLQGDQILYIDRILMNGRVRVFSRSQGSLQNKMNEATARRERAQKAERDRQAAARRAADEAARKAAEDRRFGSGRDGGSDGRHDYDRGSSRESDRGGIEVTGGPVSYD